MQKYADVVLPLPLQGTLTYALPSDCSPMPREGCRIVVPLGSRKFRTGVVIRLHDEAPPYSTKVIAEVLDETPAVLPMQLRLWKWIADYYLCTLGEVMKAALPSGMRPESESIVLPCEDWEADAPLTSGEEKVWRTLVGGRGQTLASLQKETGLKHILHVVKALTEKGAVRMKEEMKGGYRPKTVTCIRLKEPFTSEAMLHQALDTLRHSPKQAQMLGHIIAAGEPVEKTRLMHESGCTASTLHELCKKGFVEMTSTALTSPADTAWKKEEPHPLNDAQRRALHGIERQWQATNVCLLHGVTSSGKTEIYIHLMQKAVQEGKQVLFLLPEIVLTVQLTQRLRRVFGNSMGVYHSRYPEAERVALYRKMLSDEPYDIVVGVRSSIFLPFRRLGLVIIDEEHETSFKQQDPAPRYHARNAAIVLAAWSGAKTLLGSATPSLESYRNATTGKYGLVPLKTRYADLQLPSIEVVDVQEMRRKKMMDGVFSPQLIAHMREALERKRQVVLFQNRRGYAPVLECRDCGWSPRCTKCDVGLTVHRGGHQMVCHYCGSTYVIPTTCPNCQSHGLTTRGFGTERVEEQLQSILPEARIARLDLDVARSRQSYERILDDFEGGRTDVLIGTQMVTKGLDFDRVSLVGILSADQMLSQPDFRSYERAFQLMEQVAGRAGRKGEQGHVVLQTRDRESDIIRQVMAHDYEGMYARQAEERDLFGYPPFRRVVFIYLKHRDANIADDLAARLAELLRQVFGERVLGPDTPPVGRIQLMHIRKLMLKMELSASMSAVRERLLKLQTRVLATPRFHSAQIYYDVD